MTIEICTIKKDSVDIDAIKAKLNLKTLMDKKSVYICTELHSLTVGDNEVGRAQEIYETLLEMDHTPWDWHSSIIPVQNICTISYLDPDELVSLKAKYNSKTLRVFPGLFTDTLQISHGEIHLAQDIYNDLLADYHDPSHLHESIVPGDRRIRPIEIITIDCTR